MNLSGGFQIFEELGIEVGIALEQGHLRLHTVGILNGLGAGRGSDDVAQRLLLFLRHHLLDVVLGEEVVILCKNSFGDDDLLGVGIVDFHHAARIAQRFVDLLFLVPQLAQNAHVVFDMRIRGVGNHIVDIWRLGLSVTVNAAITLLKGNERPRQVVVEHTVAVIVKVDSLAAGIATYQHADMAVALAEVLYHLLLLDIAQRAIKEGDGAIVIETQVLHETVFEVFHGGATLSEDDKTVVPWLARPSEVGKPFPEAVVLAVDMTADDALQLTVHLLYVGIDGIAMLLHQCDTVVEALERGHGGRQECLEESQGEQRVGSLVTFFLLFAELIALLEFKEGFLFLGESDFLRDDLSVLEILTDIGILDVILETPDIVRLNVRLGIVAVTGDGRRLQHADDIGKTLLVAIVWSGRREYHALTMLGEHLRKVTTLAVGIADRMAFVNDDDVPLGLFDIMPELGVVLQRINGDDCLVVILKWILVGWYAALDAVNADAVKTDERNVEAIP